MESIISFFNPSNTFLLHWQKPRGALGGTKESKMDMPTTIFGESPGIRLRQTTLCDIDFVIRVESKEENIKFIIPWQRGKHESAISNEDIAHIIIEDKVTNNPLGFMIIAGLQNPNKSIEFMRIGGRGLGEKH